MRAGARFVAALLAVSGCQADQPTGIVVEVTSDLAVPADQNFHLRVFASDGRQLRDLSFHSSDLPARLDLVPERPGATVTVEASVPVGSLPLTRRATVGFRSGSLLLLRLPLEAACVCVPCDTGQTCERGLCAEVVKTVAALSPYAPRARRDAATVALPVCSTDGGSPHPGAGDAGAAGPGEGGRPVDTGPAAPPPDGGALDTARNGGPDLSGPPADATADRAPPPDGSAPPPDTALAPDLALTPDAATTPDAPADIATVTPDSAPPPDLSSGRAEGESCTASDQCLSHACVDQVCCRSACVGPCLACDNLHTGVPSGQCAPVLAGTDPHGDCAADVPMSCGYDGQCNGAGACRLYGTSTLCAAATCNGSSYTPSRNCTGAGACAPPAPQDCGLFLCTPTGCPVTCSSDAACAATAYCDGSGCVPQKPLGGACTRPRECKSGSCSLSLLCL